MKRFIVGAIVLLLVGIICAGLIWFNFFRDKMIAQFFANFPVPTVTISTVEVKPQTWTPGIDAVGTVAASRGVDVAGQVGGVVKSIAFKANDKINEGQVLIQLDDSVERSRLDAAQSTVAVSQDALERTQQLFKRNFATSADLQAAQNKLDLAKGALEELNATLAQKSIKAPFAGTIGIPKVDVGQYLQAGTAIATLQDLDRMKVDFTVPEQQLTQLKMGQPLVIGLTEDKMDFAGTITGIDPKIDPSSRLVSVQAVVDNSGDQLRPGQFVRVRVKLPEEPNVIALPQTAVIISLYGSYVYQVVEAPPPATPPAGQQGAGGAAAQGGGQAPAAGAGQEPAKPAGPQLVAKQVFVETGRRSGTQIEILKGVEPGMQIASSGQNKLSNGSHVAVDNSVDPTKETTASATP
jgi:membrane fusion protein (multidrug efflux system)